MSTETLEKLTRLETFSSMLRLFATSLHETEEIGTWLRKSAKLPKPTPARRTERWMDDASPDDVLNAVSRDVSEFLQPHFDSRPLKLWHVESVLDLVDQDLRAEFVRNLRELADRASDLAARFEDEGA